MQPWTRKYEPQKTSEVEGQQTAVSNLRGFIENFKKQKKKAVLAYGPPGSGKTCAVYALSNEFDYEVLEVNASDFRNKEKIEQIIGAATGQMSLFSKGKIILVDEIDGLSGRKDRGGTTALARIIDKSPFPIIMTSNNPWDQKFSTLRSKSQLVEFHTLSYLSVFNVLKKICKKEGVKFNETALKMLARRVGGDLRAAINDLESLARENNIIKEETVQTLGDREQLESIMNALVKVLKTTDPKVARGAFDNVNEDVDKQILWLDENLPKEYTKPEDLARAYDMLSRADVFRGRIRRWQHWRFLVYIHDFISAGVALSKDEKYNRFVKYGPTTRILKLWRANMKYMKRKAIAAKIAERTHSSTKSVIKNTLPYLQIVFKKNKKAGEQIAEQLDLDNEEVNWLKKAS